MIRRGLFLAAMLWLSCLPARADVAILIQGYLGDAGSWRQSGVTAELYAAGWHDGGHYVQGYQGVMRYGGADGRGKRFVTIDLPTEAPVPVQAQLLAAYVSALVRADGKETFHLIGHSAGGVVARFYMVRAKQAGTLPSIGGLITIASPHLGTDAAETGLAAGQSPLGLLAPFFGGSTINRSQGLYADLVRERPGSLLGWLNHQPHPAADYVSIIRAAGDDIVPAWSQDMTRVAALAGKAHSRMSGPGHGLRPGDGHLIAAILKDVGKALKVDAGGGKAPHRG